LGGIRTGKEESVSEIQRSSGIDVKMLELLACPLTKGPLVWDAERGELVSKLAKLAYPVREGIPVLLPSEARTIDPDAEPKMRPAESR
jgi:uncharacterized protein YbaR (Trm112 family)